MQEISIRHGSQMANRMLQYLTAREIADRAEGCRITGHAIPEFSLEGEASAPGNRLWPRLDIQSVDRRWLFARIKDGTLSHLRLKAVTADLDLLPSRDTANAIFKPNVPDRARVTAKDLVIALSPRDTQPSHGPLPVAWYMDLVAATKLRPVFVGELEDGAYAQALRSAFPKARFIEGPNALYRFQTIRNAHHVVIGTDTFTWMAAWLGAKTRVHYPLLGLWNPRQMPGINLTPIKDNRYRFYDFPVRHWTASAEQQQDLLADTSVATPISRKSLAPILKDARAQQAETILDWQARILGAEATLAA